jgi:polysaccharide export outer membrane protein
MAERRRARMKAWLRRVGVAVVAFVLGSTAGAQEPAADSQGNYRIGAGDVLDIVVWRNLELSRSVTVQPDGWVSFPLVNEIKVVGFTTTELRHMLTERLSAFVSAPLVTVIVAKVGSFKVSVLGKVREPGRFGLDGPTTILDMIALAGGPNEFANVDETFLLRRDGETHRRIPFDYSAAIRAGGEALNLAVQPGDIIVVP